MKPLGCINSPEDFDIVMAATRTLDEVARTMERRWGIDRLPRLMPPETAEKFYRQARRLNDALHNGTALKVQEEAARMRAAWEYCDSQARRQGLQEARTEVFEARAPDGTVYVFAPTSEAARAFEEDSGRRCVVLTAETAARIIHERMHKDGLDTLGKHFPGSIVESYRKIPHPDWEVGDDLPF